MTAQLHCLRPVGEGGGGEAAAMSAAGPVFSLLSGVVVILTGRRVGRGFGRLFWPWLGFISVQNFWPRRSPVRPLQSG